MRLRSALLVGVVVGALAVLPASLAGDAAPVAASASPAWVTTAKQRLSKLDTKPAGSMTGYSPREKSFGPAWQDVDLNGCDTRNDILARDLRQLVLKAGSDCIVAKGMLHDRYANKTINYVQGPGTSLAVQVDHMVALAAAWRTGAKEWTADRRLFYANDSLVLLSVDGPTNNAKSDKDASSWLPPNISYRCRFVARQIAIKAKYDLWVTQPERMAMADELSGC